MEYKINRKIVVALISLLLAAGVIFLTTFLHIAPTPSAPIINLNDWEISLNGNILPVRSLKDANTGIIDDSDVIVLTTTVPELKYIEPSIYFRSVHAITEIYIDDDLIYTTRDEDTENSNFSIPKYYNNAPLSCSYAGKKLTITISGSKELPSSGLSNVYIGERKDLFFYNLYTMGIYFLAGAFFSFLGFLLMILSPYLIIYHDNDLRLFFSGLISLLLGTYILAYYGILGLIVDDSYINTIAEYAALYNILTAILGYFASLFSGKKKKVFLSLFILDVILFFSSIILHFSGLLPFSMFSIILHVVANAEAIITFALIIHEQLSHRHSKERRVSPSDSIFLIGLIIFIVLAISDIFLFNFNKYFRSEGEANTDLIGFTIGSFVFVCCLLVSYLYYNVYSNNFASMQSHIKSLAYTDALTGLANRARCEQVMNMLSEEKNIYTLISFDLNRLKHINDTLGHHEGDRLLTGFSTILSECFWDANLIGRMGGDEFIVILIEEHSLNCTKRIHELYSILEEWNRKEQAFTYSASYGYAYSYEVPSGSAKEVYMLADSRMYEMKREHHGDEKEDSRHA